MGRFSRSARHVYKRTVKNIKQVFSKGKTTAASNPSLSLSPATKPQTADERDTEHDPADVSIALQAPPPTHAAPTESLRSTPVTQNESNSTAKVVEIEPCVNAAGQPENNLVASTAPQPDPNCANDQVSQPLSHKDAPLWNAALKELKTNHPQLFKEFECAINKIIESPNKNADDIFDEVPKRFSGNPKTNEFLKRAKQYLPSLAAVRGVAMTAAALDPHKVAPIVCATIFFSIDFALNTVDTDTANKILDAFFESGNAIDEGISFEARYSLKTHPAIQKDVADLEKLLPEIYLQALEIVSDIQRTSRLVKLTGKPTTLDSQKTKLKVHMTKWSSKKRLLEDKLSADADVTEVLKWIRKEDDPEPTLEDIRLKVNPKDRYEDCAQWFLDVREFQSWSKGFQTSENEYEYKQALWISGGYGTGKTTIMYRVVSTLQNLTEVPFRDTDLRVIPYFCNAAGVPTKRPDYETIIRSMSQKLSLMPDFRLARQAETLHSRTTRGLHQLVNVDSWEKLLRDLLSESSDQSNFVFVIDALDECEAAEDAERILGFMSEIMKEHSNVQLLCSSHQHVRVERYLPEILHTVELTASASTMDMEAFVDGEIEYLRGEIREDSIFFMPDHDDLLDLLRESLNKYANGMFRWVEIWLNILLPTYNDQKNIEREKDARELLDALKYSSRDKNESYTQLEAGYERLWGLNTIKGYDNVRTRLFRLIFCSFKPLSLATLTHALRIQIDGSGGYDTELTNDRVRRLYLNFLTEDTSGHLGFIHDSAREFISKIKRQGGADSLEDDTLEFSDRRNHLSVAKLYIEVAKRPDHPVWRELDLDPSDWRDELRFNRETGEKLSKEGNIMEYIVYHGVKHCRSAAKRQSICDELWAEVLSHVILPHRSVSPFIAFLSENYHDWPSILGRDVFWKYDGQHELLYSHVLADLNIVDENDFSDSQLMSLAEAHLDSDSHEGRLRLLLQHAKIRNYRGETALHIACRGGSNALVKLILQGTFHLYGGPASLYLLFAGRHQPGFETPFTIALENSQYVMMETLLRFEIHVGSTTSNDHRSSPSENSYKTLQWSHECKWERRTALSLATEELDEDTMCRLLSLAQPMGIDTQDKFGETALHIAASKGYLRLMSMLVENYKADINVLNTKGRSPAFYAYFYSQVEALRYLQSKGAQEIFCEEDENAKIPGEMKSIDSTDSEYPFGDGAERGFHSSDSAESGYDSPNEFIWQYDGN